MNFYLISNSFKSFYLFRKEIIKELDEKYTIILIANKDEYLDYFKRKYKCISFDGHFNSKSILKNFLLIFKIILIFFKQKPSIVQTYTIHPNLVCIPLAKFFFSKTCSMITGMGSTSVTKKLLLKKIIDLCYKFSFTFCDNIIFVNKHNEKYFQKKLGINKNSIRIFGAGVNKKNIIKKKNFIVQKYNLKNTFNILFIGRLTKEKGILDALKIFKMINIPNKRMIIVGGLDINSFSGKINIKELNYPGIIKLGHQVNTEEYYQFANVFLLPSITEGMPTTLMESIINEVPSICYDIPGVEDILINNLNGIKIKIKDFNAAVNAINKIYRSKKFSNYLIENSNKHKIKINRNNVVSKVVNFYDKIS